MNWMADQLKNLSTEIHRSMNINISYEYSLQASGRVMNTIHNLYNPEHIGIIMTVLTRDDWSCQKSIKPYSYPILYSRCHLHFITFGLSSIYSITPYLEPVITSPYQDTRIPGYQNTRLPAIYFHWIRISRTEIWNLCLHCSLFSFVSW